MNDQMLTYQAAQQLKQELLAPLQEPVQWQSDISFQMVPAASRVTAPVAVGLCKDQPSGGYGIAIRVQEDSEHAVPEAKRIAERAAAQNAPVDLDTDYQPIVIHAHSGTNLPDGATQLRNPMSELRIGISIGHANGGAGSLGCFVMQHGRPGILSCCHVLATPDHYLGRSVDPVLIHQPGRPDITAFTGTTRIAKLEGSFLEFNDATVADAAIALLLDPQKKKKRYSNRFPGNVGPAVDNRRLGKELDPGLIIPSLKVGKVGRESGFTCGTISAVELSPVRIEHKGLGKQFLFHEVIEVEGTEGQPFCGFGDSGAIVFTLPKLQPLGLVFAAREKTACSPAKTYVCLLHKARLALGGNVRLL